jgi:hypothetical protein
MYAALKRIRLGLIREGSKNKNDRKKEKPPIAVTLTTWRFMKKNSK